MFFPENSKKTDVLMVGTDPNSKGGISSVIRLYEEGGLFQRVRFLASYTDGGFWKKLRYYGGFLMEYVQVLNQNKNIRLVHIHTASYGSFARKTWVILLAKLYRKNIALHVHGAEFALFYQRANILKQQWIRFLLNQCHVIFALSHQWKQDLGRIVPGKDIRVLYNPTVLRDLSLEKGISHQGLREEPVKFLFMGRIGKRKGVYDIIESARALSAKNVQIQLYGDGEVDAIESLINAQGLQDIVQVKGWIDGSRKDQTFRDANVLLLPSYNEGLPISVLEALAYGLPVLATDVGGISEAVEEGRNGFLIQPGQCERLTERMERLAASPELRTQMGQAGYDIAAERFSLPVIMNQLESLYDEFTQPA